MFLSLLVCTVGLTVWVLLSDGVNKLLKTTEMQVVCRDQFNSVLPSMQLDRRRTNFVSSPVTTDLVKFFPV